MTEEFKATIKSYKEPLFYNTEGSKEAYQRCIRQLSSAMSAGFSKLSNGYMIPYNTLHIVDLEREVI